MKTLLSTVCFFVSMSIFAVEVRYHCLSETDLTIFEYGKSSKITIELNGGFLSINNFSGIANHLVCSDVRGEQAYFISMAKQVVLQSDDLIAIMDLALIDGAKTSGKLVLEKKRIGPNLKQIYTCTVD